MLSYLPYYTTLYFTVYLYLLNYTFFVSVMWLLCIVLYSGGCMFACFTYWYHFNLVFTPQKAK